MPLKEYRAKRDFTKSPEPAGDEQTAKTRAGGRTRFFCVQKHLATALHYDFRLEHDGVLLSWAVPKGPSLDPSIKRLAMHVEDHPIEYGTFEGVIPEGYGAGVVMLWDQGTWTPEQDDIDAALKKGDLKFTLDGFKLKGSWVLVRTKGWGSRGKEKDSSGGGSDSGKTSWLLIKHRDDWAGPIDIATFAPLSVKSGEGFRGILTQEAPGVWHSNRAAAGMTGEAALAKIVEKVIALEAEDGTGDGAGATAAAAKTTKTAKPAKSATAAKATAAESDAETESAPRAKSAAAPRKATAARKASAAGASQEPADATPPRRARKSANKATAKATRAKA